MHLQFTTELIGEIPNYAYVVLEIYQYDINGTNNDGDDWISGNNKIHCINDDAEFQTDAHGTMNQVRHIHKFSIAASGQFLTLIRWQFSE